MCGPRSMYSSASLFGVFGVPPICGVGVVFSIVFSAVICFLHYTVVNNICHFKNKKTYTHPCF